MLLRSASPKRQNLSLPNGRGFFSNALAFFLLIVSAVVASAQPAAVQINPATGLPEDGPALHLNPVVMNPPADTGMIPFGSTPPFIPPHRDLLDEEAGGPAYALPGPGEKPNFAKILLQEIILTKKKRYEEALQHLVFYYTNTETNPAQKGGRASFAIGDWVELGDQYPKARQSLIDIRDEYGQRLLDGQGSSGLFQDVVAMNKDLGSDGDSYTLFKSIEKRDPRLARQCYYWVEDQLVQKHEFDTCRKYIGTPQADYKRICKRYDQGLWGVRHEIEMSKIGPEPVMPPWFPHVPDRADRAASLKKYMEDRFVNEVGNLIEILVATGSESDAENIQKQALTVLNDPRLETAVADAKAKVAKVP